MKKAFLRILIFILGLGFVFGTCGVIPAFAADSHSSALEGNIIDCSKYEHMDIDGDGEEDEGGGVICILKIVLNVMSFGIGVLAVVGIVLSGIQYITSQGDPGKMAKAKNRIIQVVIGLVIYAVLYAALYFLVPGFNTAMLNGNGGNNAASVTCRIVKTDGGRSTTLECGGILYGNITTDGKTSAICNGNKLSFKNGHNYSVTIDNVSNCSDAAKAVNNAAK